MKGKKLLALLLTLVLIAALAVPALAVETFTDVEKHWAKAEIMKMAEKGIITGYGDGRYGPDDPVANSAGLALCARLAVTDVETRLQILADRDDEITALFPTYDAGWWFRKEAATCLEMGIIDFDTLEQMVKADALNQPMTKGDFARYLVRAMGLADMTKTFSNAYLSYADAADLDPALRPYVKILSEWGVVNGDDNNLFGGNQSMTRGVCATMLTRAMDRVESRKISLEIPRYTSYPWIAGYVTDVSVSSSGDRTLTLETPFDGEKTVPLPAEEGKRVVVYRYNFPVEYTALEVGAYARVCYAADGITPEAIRLMAKDLATTYTGVCAALTPKSITVGGAEYLIDRFTQVSAGGKTGDASIIDYDAKYTTATVTADPSGHVMHMTLAGGTRQVEGILADVAVTAVGALTKTSITVNSYGGVATVYEVPADAAITVDGATATLQESLKGRQVILRVKDSDLTDIRAVNVNATDKYIQGILQKTNAAAEPRTADITARVGNADTTAKYELSSDCAVLYMDKEIAFSSLPNSIYVTAKIQGGSVTWLAGYQGYETVEGTLTGVEYDDPTVLKITLDSGVVNSYSIPTADFKNITIKRSGSAVDVTKLVTGDRVAITVLYNKVSQIDATPRQANITGTVRQITWKADGSVELVVGFSDGTSDTYLASAGTTVTRDGATSNLNSLRTNETVAIVADGNRAASIQVTGAVTTKGEVTGTVYSKEDASRTVYLRVVDPVTSQVQIVSVQMASNITIVDATTGNTVSGFTRVHVGDSLHIWGSYNNSGVFVAATVVRTAAA